MIALSGGRHMLPLLSACKVRRKENLFVCLNKKKKKPSERNSSLCYVVKSVVSPPSPVEPKCQSSGAHVHASRPSDDALRAAEVADRGRKGGRESANKK